MISIDSVSDSIESYVNSILINIVCLGFFEILRTAIAKSKTTDDTLKQGRNRDHGVLF